MNKSETINYEDGKDVWQMQMFTLPKSQYDTAIDIIEKERIITELEGKLEEAKAIVTLEVAKDESLKNQSVRDAKTTIELAKNEAYQLAKNKIADLQREADVLKARQKKYELDFKTVKDSVYYAFRTSELSAQKEVKDSEAKRYNEQ